MISAVVAAVGWAAGALLLWRLPVLAARAPSRARSTAGLSVSIVVPARNEAANLPALLTSIAAQGRPAELVVVDDSSTDGTAEVARAEGATVVTAPEPPVGWLGKPWALHSGLAATTGDVVVLLDADVALGDGALEQLLAVHAEEVPDGLLSVQPHHEVRRPYEHLSLLGNIVPLMAAGIARPRRRGPADDPIAFGPCLVTTRAALDAVGGFAVVAGSITEDLALARRYRQAGRPVRCCTGGELVRFRMYPDGLRSLADGWTKHLATGAAAAPLVPTVGAVLWVTALLTSIGLVASSAVAGRWLLGAGVWLAVAAQLRWMSRRVGSFRGWAAAAYPVPVLAFVALFARSALLRLVGRPVAWRGRRIRTGEIVG